MFLNFEDLPDLSDRPSSSLHAVIISLVNSFPHILIFSVDFVEQLPRSIEHIRMIDMILSKDIVVYNNSPSVAKNRKLKIENEKKNLFQYLINLTLISN